MTRQRSMAGERVEFGAEFGRPGIGSDLAHDAGHLLRQHVVTQRNAGVGLSQAVRGASHQRPELAGLVVVDKQLLGEGDIKKHELLVGYVQDELYAEGKRATSLEKVCDAILAFASSGLTDTRTQIAKVEAKSDAAPALVEVIV